MKHSNLQITLPKPCSEDWDTMAPADRGRYCASCQKTVIDFTLLSDGEILDIFKKAKDNPPCGHFSSTQLDRELIDTRYKPSFVGLLVKRAAAVVILFQSIAATALAQQVKHRNSSTISAGKNKKLQLKDSVSSERKPIKIVPVNTMSPFYDKLQKKEVVFPLSLRVRPGGNVYIIDGTPMMSVVEPDTSLWQRVTRAWRESFE